VGSGRGAVNWRRCLELAIGLSIPAAATCASTAEREADPLRFFVGNTEMVSTTKIITQKPFVTHSLGRGSIGEDGALELVQHVNELGRRQFDRFWHIRKVAPNRFGGTMSEANGPVTVEKRGARYLFRFRLKDDLAVEEWLIPQGESAARILVTIRKFGIAVVHTQGWIRRVS